MDPDREASILAIQGMLSMLDLEDLKELEESLRAVVRDREAQSVCPPKSRSTRSLESLDSYWSSDSDCDGSCDFTLELKMFLP